jgi:hypothetical protein
MYKFGGRRLPIQRNFQEVAVAAARLHKVLFEFRQARGQIYYLRTTRRPIVVHVSTEGIGELDRSSFRCSITKVAS